MKQIIYSLLFLCFYPAAYSQTITADTTLANQYFDLAKSYCFKMQQIDSASFFLDKAQPLYIKYLGEKSLKNANVSNLLGIIYNYYGLYDKSLEYFSKCLMIRKEILGEKNMDVALSYNNIGIVYNDKCEYDLALKYCLKSIEIQQQLTDKKLIGLSNAYNGIGNIYKEKTEYDVALEYYFKSAAICKELFGEKSIELAYAYGNIGIIYSTKCEYDIALEYEHKTLEMLKEQFGEKNKDVANAYNNIGTTFRKIKQYDKALEYLFKSLSIRKELLGEKHLVVADSYTNIGTIYDDKLQYDKALEYQLKSLNILEELHYEKSIEIAAVLQNLGSVNLSKNQYNQALEYFLKCLKVNIKIFGEKNANTTFTYNNIGQTYYNKLDYSTALKYLQKGLSSCLLNFNDTLNIYGCPKITNYLDWNVLLVMLDSKAQIFANYGKNLPVFKNPIDLQKLALRHYQACDTLISQVRQIITSESDKLALAEKANSVYTEAIAVCLQLATVAPSRDLALQQAFYFSEKNKGMILQESMADKNGLAYSGIPDSLLTKEHSLRIDIKLFQSKLAEGQDSVMEISFRNKLFAANQTYDSLIKVFETSFPAYYNLKHNSKTVSIVDLQKELDNKTQIRSYTMADSVVYISTISKKKFDVIGINIPKTLADSVQLYRTSLHYITENTKEHYKRLGVWLFNVLFPDYQTIDKKLKDMVIIPDGCLTTIPFETLLVLPVKENYQTNTQSVKIANNRGDSFKEIKNSIASGNYWEYPYLLKNFNISYSYSATLWQSNFNTKTIKVANLNDFIALAPVFSENDEQGVLLASQNYVDQWQKIKTDTTQTRGKAIDGHHINALPATESEVKTIFKYFDAKKFKAVVRLHKNANEQFVKSGALQNYRIIHFATHGFVNSEKPDLSGILLAQDSTGGQDGILYASEIFNLKFNADLTVLSACETGLGKIRKGEGLIGLTRALMFAGSKNVLVSLWPVDDSATSLLMMGFYNKLVNIDNNKSEFKDCLRYAKLKLLESRKYAHPYYWSPFILVGQ